MVRKGLVILTSIVRYGRSSMIREYPSWASSPKGIGGLVSGHPIEQRSKSSQVDGRG